MFTYDVYLRMILRPTFTPVLSPPFEPGYHETVRAVFAAEKSKEGAGVAVFAALHQVLGFYGGTLD